MKLIQITGLILLLPVMAVGQGITVDHVDGLNAEGAIENGTTLTFHMRLTNTYDGPVIGIDNGFWVYSDGMTWGAVSGYLNDNICWTYDESDPCTPYVFDMGPFIHVQGDTVGFGAVVYPSLRPEGDGVGLEPGFDDVGYYIQVGPITVGDGTYLTLDSCLYFPVGYWTWLAHVDGEIARVTCNWGGPYTYKIPVSTTLSQMPIILKDLQSDVLEVCVHNEDVDEVDLCSVRVNGNIPPYETECARIVGTDIVTTCYIHRFLSKYQPIKDPVCGLYTVSYMKGDQEVTITGEVWVEIHPGD